MGDMAEAGPSSDDVRHAARRGLAEIARAGTTAGPIPDHYTAGPELNREGRGALPDRPADSQCLRRERANGKD